MQQRKYPEAIKAYKRAVELNPTQPDAHYRLGRIYQAMGATADSKKEFAKTAELHQKNDTAVLQLKTPRLNP
jgi:tetratricopeptide (TPR) repeat protein